ncbi:MAG: sigma 54-interacting transcriptional regulator, partial [Deltaproteobacteria bacterium]|nr:sigma 54-interacting transcriptional regulator [Deltaproteobacteria bacterium]
KLDRVLGYQLEGLLGKGSFSEVYKGRKGKHLAAIKLMRPQRGTHGGHESMIDPQTILSSLRYEFWVLKDLAHSNIVRLFDFGQLDDGRIFLIEEFIEGQTLDQFCGHRPFVECEPVFIGMLQGLQELNRWHIVHGDLKPANILVCTGNEGPIAKILDFGMAKAEQIFPGATAPLGGTPATMAPEVILNRPSDHRSDLYSLGVSFYSALTGKNPFVGKTVDETCKAHLQKIPEPIGILRNDIPPLWAELIHRLIAKNPADRPQSALKVLSLVTRESFVLAPTAFVGRKATIDRALSILLNRKDKEKISIVVEGDPGIGVSRFLRELFYQVIGQKPSLRKTISLVEQDSPPKTDLLLIDGSTLLTINPPTTHRVEKIELKPFTRAELLEWLSLVFNLREIPDDFIDRLHGISKGNPGTVWSFLTWLSEQNVLADASGRVTTSTLSLINWEYLLSGVGEQFEESFEWIFSEIGRRVQRREIREEDPLWAKLFQLIDAIKDGAERLKKRALGLAKQGEALIDEGKWERAREVLNSALEIFRNDARLALEEIRTRNFLAYIQLRQGRVREAIEAFELCRDEMRQKLSPDEIRKIANLDLGLAYLQAGDYRKAVSQLEEELKQAEPSRETAIFYNIAQSWAGSGDTARAEEYFHKALKGARDNRDPAFILRALNGLGNILRGSERWNGERGSDLFRPSERGVRGRQRQSPRFKEALGFYSEALEVALAISDNSSASAASQNRGALCASKGLYDEAIHDLQDSLKYAGKIAVHYAFEKRLICRSYVELGEIAVSRGRPREGINPLDRAWHMAEADEDLENFRFWVLLGRARVWKALKDDEALKKELARLNFYADNEEKRKEADELMQSITKQAGPDETKAESIFAPELEALLRINRDLVGEMPLDDLLRRLLGHAIELSGAELGVLLTADEKGNLTPALSLNATLSPELSEISFSVAKRVLETGKTVKSADAKADEQFNQYASVIALNLRSIVGVPIVFRGKLLGVLYLSHRYRHGAFDDRLIRTLDAFADQAGLALTNHQLLEFYRNAQEKLKADLDESQVDLKRTREKIRSLPDDLKYKLTDRPMLTRSPAMIELLKAMDRLAESAVSVVINGETGTGKELLARYIHENSPRKQKPFSAVNCGALPANLIESELFGHVKGAFTGADRDKVGLIEAANGGTLFLDEIADLPLDLQVKLLRALQEREVLRVGDRSARPVDIRVVAASHKNLRSAMEMKKFREDLYYRLAGFEVTLPALRERLEDIPLLAEYFLKEYRLEMKRKKPERIGGALMKILEEYSWPGNIRELKNFTATTAALCEKMVLNADSIPKYLQERIVGRGVLPQGGTTSWQYAPTSGFYHSGLSWADHERLVFVSALAALDFDVPRTALSLGISIATAYKWMRENHFRETASEWQKKVFPYSEGTRLTQIRKNVFSQIAKKYPGQPYKAARELNVAPMTFYKWTKQFPPPQVRES